MYKGKERSTRESRSLALAEYSLVLGGDGQDEAWMNV